MDIYFPESDRSVESRSKDAQHRLVRQGTDRSLRVVASSELFLQGFLYLT